MSDAPDSPKSQPPNVSLEDEREPDGPKIGPAGRQKVGMLSTGVSRAIIISTILLCSVWMFLALMSLDRYRIVPVNNANAISVFRIDQLKDDVHICTPQARTLVSMKPAASGQ